MIQPAYSGRSRKISPFFCVLLLFFCPVISIANMQPKPIPLSPPAFQEKDFHALLEKRYSCREFKDRSLKLDDLAGILWAACGKKYDALTEASRTIPSAGATYPLELYLVVGKSSVDKLSQGVYHYLIDRHALELVKDRDVRQELASASLGQGFIRQAPVSVVIAAKFIRTTQRYGARGERYVYMEAGHASQNTYLSVYALGLVTVEVGAFSDKQVSEVLGLEKDIVALIIMPVGYP
jgi:SagB-type dehydrogenase family enzyme